MASVQVNLLLLTCAVVLLYVSVTPVEALSAHCGKHYHDNEYITRYYTAYIRRYYPLYYGYCTSGNWTRDEKVYNTNGDRLYYMKTYYYGNFILRRSSSTGQVGTYSGTTNRDTGLSENEQTKRDVEAKDNIKKRIQVSDYAEILQALKKKKRTEKAFQKAEYGKVLKNSAVKKEAEETKEQA